MKLNTIKVDRVTQSLKAHRVSQELALKDSWDDADLWGSVMEESFVLCDFVMFDLGAGELIPSELQYSPGVFGPYTESFMYSTIVEMWPSSGLDYRDVIQYLELLNEAITVYKEAKLDY